MSVEFATALVVAVALSGCASAQMPGLINAAAVSAPIAHQPFIAPGQRLVLPRPADLGRRAEARQLVTLRHNGNILTFEARLSVTPERISLVAIDPLGRRALTVTWDGTAIAAETAPWLPDAVKPGSLLADLVAVYWPETVVRGALASAGGDVIAGPRTRVIRLGGATIFRAEYGWAQGAQWTGKLHYTNLAWGYEVDVQSLELKG